MNSLPTWAWILVVVGGLLLAWYLTRESVIPAGGLNNGKS